MTRSALERELVALQDEMQFLASMVERAITRTIEALKARDVVEAQRIIADDQQINTKRFQIEERCIQLIATQQPLAGDLRIIVSVLYVIVELERMGDYAEGIAKITVMMGDEPLLKPLIDIPRMADKCKEMLKRSVRAFVERDAEEAVRIAQQDDEVDSLYDQVYRELLTYMVDDPHTIRRATYLLWVAHDLERLADRCTNIAERVVYIVTGKMEEIGASRY